MEQIRYSPQREMILRYLRSSREHPSAETVFQALKRDHSKLSRGTVYRNLNQMAELGMIVKMPLHVERFDAVVTPHAHFWCRKCDRIYDLDMPLSDTRLCDLTERTGHSVEREERIFLGECADCRKK